MKAFRTVLFCIGILTIAKAAPIHDSTAQPTAYEYDYEASAQQGVQEPEESASHYDAYIHDVQAAATGDSQKKGFSRGSGLRTIAVGSANQAKTALGNQAAAGYQAAYVAKNTLAQSAAQASATAQAALAGKQVILSGLEQQVRDAKVALQGEEMQLQQAKRAAQSAAQAAQQAMHQVNVIQAALNAAQATSENANEAASQAAGELGAQTAMVGAARQRLQTLQEQLRGVRIDFEATQAAARKAQAAAQAAQANAAEAAAKAAAAGLGQKHDSSHEETSASQQLDSTATPTFRLQKQHDALPYRGVSNNYFRNSIKPAPFESKLKPVPVPVAFDNTVEIQVLGEHDTHNHNKYNESIPEIEFEESKAKEKQVNKQQVKPIRVLDAHFSKTVFPQAYVDVNKFFQIQAKERRPSNSWSWW